MKRVPIRPLSDSQLKSIFSRSITNNLNIILEKLILKSKELNSQKSKYNEELNSVLNDKETLIFIQKEIISKEKGVNKLNDIEGLVEPNQSELNGFIKDYIELLNLTNTLHKLKLKQLSNGEGNSLPYVEDNINFDLIDNDIIFDFQMTAETNYDKPESKQLKKEIVNPIYPILFTPSFSKQKINYNSKTIKTFNCLFKDNNKGTKKKLFSLRAQIQKDKMNNSKTKGIIMGNSKLILKTNKAINMSLPDIKKKTKSMKEGKQNSVNDTWYGLINHDSNHNKYSGNSKIISLRNSTQETMTPKLLKSNRFDLEPQTSTSTNNKIRPSKRHSLKLWKKKGTFKLMQVIIKREALQKKIIKREVFFILIKYQYSSIIHNVLFSYCETIVYPFKAFFFLQMKKANFTSVVRHNDKLQYLLSNYFEYKQRCFLQCILKILRQINKDLKLSKMLSDNSQ